MLKKKTYAKCRIIHQLTIHSYILIHRLTIHSYILSTKDSHYAAVFLVLRALVVAAGVVCFAFTERCRDLRAVTGCSQLSVFGSIFSPSLNLERCFSSKNHKRLNDDTIIFRILQYFNKTSIPHYLN